MGDDSEDDVSGSTTISPERAAELEATEEFILSVSERGFGKRSSAYEYRSTGRGGQGIQNMEVNDRNGKIVATFPIAMQDGLMLVSDGGQVIRTGVSEVRIAGRRTQGVTLFRVSADERVVSVARLADDGNEADETEIEDGAPIAESPTEPTL
jgi:DNA gyrase subunit A